MSIIVDWKKEKEKEKRKWLKMSKHNSGFNGH